MIYSFDSSVEALIVLLIISYLQSLFPCSHRVLSRRLQLRQRTTGRPSSLALKWTREISWIVSWVRSLLRRSAPSSLKWTKVRCDDLKQSLSLPLSFSPSPSLSLSSSLSLSLSPSPSPSPSLSLSLSHYNCHCRIQHTRYFVLHAL